MKSGYLSLGEANTSFIWFINLRIRVLHLNEKQIRLDK